MSNDRRDVIAAAYAEGARAMQHACIGVTAPVDICSATVEGRARILERLAVEGAVRALDVPWPESSSLARLRAPVLDHSPFDELACRILEAQVRMIRNPDVSARDALDRQAPEVRAGAFGAAVAVMGYLREQFGIGS